MTQDPNASVTRDGAKAADDTLSDLQASARHMADQAASKARDTLEAGREYVDRARDAGQEYAERAYEVGKRKAEEAAFYTELGYEEAVFLVRRNPGKALGIAAGIGFLLGLVTARR